MMNWKRYLVVGAVLLSASPVLADSITPTSIACVMSVGSICSFGKTLTVDAVVGASVASVGYSVVGLDFTEVPSYIGTAATPTSYTGSFDRSITRNFGFTVAFTGLAPGDSSFNVYGLVDGVRVATETDRITVVETEPIPEPTTLLLVGTGLLGFARWRKQRH